MAFNSIPYIIFLAATFFAYTITPKKAKWAVLLLASYAFYFISSRKLIVFILISTLTIYIAGITLNKLQDMFKKEKDGKTKEEKKALKKQFGKKKKAIAAIVLIINFGILAFLKYYNFFGTSVNSLLSGLNVSAQLPALDLVLPLGISFYTLQAVSYVIDVYRGKYRASGNFFKVALFLSFFPQIVEGPIGRFDDIGESLYEGHKFDYNNFSQGLELIVWGLLKKVVIADRANALVSKVFDHYTDYSGVVIVAAILFYTLQIYAEFSGCMDIVLGSAQIFGVKLAKNFDQPFFSKSVSEFWRRWHITLGAWLKDYIFYPISLSKAFTKLSRFTQKHLSSYFGQILPSAFALFFVWFGNGIWHGANWNFILYGLYYYVIMMFGLVFEPLFLKFFSTTKIKRDGKAFSSFRIFRTFILVNIGMLIFRSNTFTDAVQMFRLIFKGFTLKTLTDGSLLKFGLCSRDMAVLALGVIVMLVVGIVKEKGHDIRKELSEKNIVLRWAVWIVCILAVVVLGAYGAGYEPVDFIYAHF